MVEGFVNGAACRPGAADEMGSKAVNAASEVPTAGRMAVPVLLDGWVDVKSTGSEAIVSFAGCRCQAAVPLPTLPSPPAFRGGSLCDALPWCSVRKLPFAACCETADGSAS